MGRAEDLFGGIPEEDTPSTHRHVSPYPGGRTYMHDGASTLTEGAPAAFLVRSHPQIQSSIPRLELIIGHKDVFQTEQGYDKHSEKAHRFLLFQ